jgi:hypothetical protein
MQQEINWPAEGTARAGYWMYETSGVLRPAVVAFLEVKMQKKPQP